MLGFVKLYINMENTGRKTQCYSVSGFCGSFCTNYFSLCTCIISGLPRWLSEKGFICQCRRCELSPWVGKIPWRRKWQPTPILPEKSLGQRSLAGYSPWGSKELGMTQQLRARAGEHTHVSLLH